MRLAFYAPLKPPTHPVPSGDRRIARLLLLALRRAGHEVRVVSDFRSYEGKGASSAQEKLRRRGAAVAREVADRLRRWKPDLWFTYHLYHKAPDWLGPIIAALLDIPYVVAEAAYAPRRSRGHWRPGLDAVAGALGRADAVVFLNPLDRECVEPLMKRGAKVVPLAPFLDTSPFAAARRGRSAHRKRLARKLNLPEREPWLLTVAMMRPGDKLASYRLLARALARIAEKRWHLIIVGGGPAEREVRATFARFKHRVRFLGTQAESVLPPLYVAADLFVWPAVNEAIGQAILEAQAAGVPVVAGKAGAIDRIVAHGRTGLLVSGGDAGAIARATGALLDNPRRLRRMGAVAFEKSATEHGIANAAEELDLMVRQLHRERAA